MPDFVEALPAPLRAHASEEIDFAALRGKVVAVLGAGASAFDNAATALEAGAAEVHLFCRRAEPMIIQPYRWLTFAGFLRHMHEMPDEWRWRFMSYILGLREGFPQDTYTRVLAFPNFTMHVGRPWTGARAEGGRAVLETARGDFTADYADLRHRRADGPGQRAGTGRLRRQHRALGATATARRRRRRMSACRASPTSRRTTPSSRSAPGETPWIRDIHLFGIGTSLSFGPAGSSINAMIDRRAAPGGRHHARAVRGGHAAALCRPAGLRDPAGDAGPGAACRGVGRRFGSSTARSGSATA